MEPKIRINGFNDNWNETTLGSLCTSDHSNLTLGDISNLIGEYPIFGASGYIKNIDSFKQRNRYIGIVKDGAGAGRAFVCPAYSSILATMNYIIPQKGVDTDFLLNIINSIDFSKYITGSTIPHIYFKTYSAEKVYIPKEEEQQALGSYFLHLDFLILSTSKKIESLKQVKTASLQSMFPQGEDNTPRVRIGKRIEPWYTCKLNDILAERHEASTITQDLPQLSFTIAEGVIRPEDRKSNQRDFLIKDKDNKRYLITRVGDIIYNPANVVYGAIHRNSLIDGVVSPIYRIFTTNQDSRFIECVVRRPSFISQLAMRTEGTVTKLKTLKPEAFLDMTVSIPTDLEEQRMIGEYFRNLDSQIDLQTLRLEKLKQIKSACLDNMFV